MNPLVTAIGIEAFRYLAPAAQSFIEGLLKSAPKEDESPFIRPSDIDAGYQILSLQAELEAAQSELADVAAERDDLRRQLRAARYAHEDLHRALFPGQY